jgi:hypothetical protein
MNQQNYDDQNQASESQLQNQQSVGENESQGYNQNQYDENNYNQDEEQQPPQSHDDSRAMDEILSTFDPEPKYPAKENAPQHAATENNRIPDLRYGFQENNNSNFGTEWESDRGNN